MKVVRGVLFGLADTLAAHSVGGFKVGVGLSANVGCALLLKTNYQKR